MSERESRLRQQGKRLRESNERAINGHDQPCDLAHCRRALCDNDREKTRLGNRVRAARRRATA